MNHKETSGGNTPAWAFFSPAMNYILKKLLEFIKWIPKSSSMQWAASIATKKFAWCSSGKQVAWEIPRDSHHGMEHENKTYLEEHFQLSAEDYKCLNKWNANYYIAIEAQLVFIHSEPHVILHKFQKAIQNYLAYCFLQTTTFLETHKWEPRHEEKNGFICGLIFFSSDPKPNKKTIQEQA